jgi:hypothetical protein
VTSNSRNLEGSAVTGSLYKPIAMYLGNRYDPINAPIPTIAGNVKGYTDVAIKDTWTEFGTDWTFVESESLDITTAGLITLRVDFATYNQFFEANYALESAAFQKFVGVKLASSTMPIDVAVTVSGAEDLAAGTLKLHIPDFEMPDGVQFVLQYQLVSALVSVLLALKYTFVMYLAVRRLNS